MTPEMLARIGQALYGELWQSQMARALGVADRTMRRWISGDNTIPDGVAAELQSLIAKRLKLLKEIDDDLDGTGI